MWISLSWLRDYVDVGERTPERVAEDLTLRTALIEGIVRRGEFPDAVMVGKVLECRPHPDADRLRVCLVSVGGAEPQEIVCGAPNVAAGQTVAVATVGAVLPGDFKIKRSKIRGITSNGMICSERELELGDDQDGIMVLEPELESGRPLAEVAGVRDVVLEIDNKSITHRPDLWGHEGFARELAAIYGLDLRPPDLDASLRPGRGPVEVRIEAPELCGRYCALLLRGSLGGPAPGWLRRRLVHCGLRPRSLGVDVSNYVMLDVGQPTHPFDAGRIGGGVIRVRAAGVGERLVTLDGQERELPAGACVIADAEHPIAVAGIIGGAASGIGPGTAAAVLESAWFDPIAVRRTSTALGLRTDALARFEKFLDPAWAERGMRRYAAVLRAVAPGVEIAPEFAAVGEARQEPVRLRLRASRARAKLGIDVDLAVARRRLQALGFQATEDGPDLEVVVPPFRATRDVSREDDLIEEVGRIDGYERVPEALPRVACRPVALEPVNAAWRGIVALLVGRFGFAEVVSYAFVDDAVLARARADEGPHVVLRNPQQQNARRLRRSLVPGLLEFVDRNVKSVEEVRLFECGQVFVPNAEGPGLPAEPRLLAAAWAERVTRKGEEGGVLRRLQGALEDVLARTGRDARFEPFAAAPAWLHPARSARVLIGDVEVGCFGQLHPDAADDFGWQGESALMQVDLTRIMGQPPAPPTYEPPPRFPPARLDISFVAPYSLRYDRIRDGLHAACARLDRVDLVDEYRDGVAAGERSLTLRLSFRDPERTLNDDEVGVELQRARTWLQQAGAVLRG